MTGRRAALLAFLLAAAASPAAAQQWAPFQPGGAGFRVDFPGRPAINADNSFGTRYGRSVSVTATVETADGVAFYATYTAYPRGTASSEPDKVLDTVRIGRTAIGTLRAQQRFQFDGHLAQRDMIDWHRPRRLVIVSLDVTRGDWLYSIYCFAPPGLENSPAIQRFLASFALLPQ
ncbi:MAG: hypothetical protein JSR24_11680 [Proteobacteria bacterium]|nr:hypothetical protein [Pseudomonadota bacterium]